MSPGIRLNCGYASIAVLFERIAPDPSIAPGLQLTRFRDARIHYRKSLDVLLELRARNALLQLRDGDPEKMKQSIERCDAALARVSRSGAVAAEKR